MGFEEVQSNTDTPQEFKYQKVDVFDIDGQLRGPIIYKPLQSVDGNKDDKNRGIMLNTSDEQDAFNVLRAMAEKYGFSAKRLRRILENDYDLCPSYRFNHSSIDEEFDWCWCVNRELNGIRFVQRGCGSSDTD